MGTLVTGISGPCRGSNSLRSSLLLSRSMWEELVVFDGGQGVQRAIKMARSKTDAAPSGNTLSRLVALRRRDTASFLTRFRGFLLQSGSRCCQSHRLFRSEALNRGARVQH